MTPARLAEIEKLIEGYPDGDEGDWLVAALMSIRELLAALREAQQERAMLLREAAALRGIRCERDALQKRVQGLEKFVAHKTTCEVRWLAGALFPRANRIGCTCGLEAALRSGEAG